ncbi:MAG: pimeloyl-ACP methyl ester carboxylesterase [Maribacter sp.]|jgi:pimeloyl-ACP methyl ester carboxylesterase
MQAISRILRKKRFYIIMGICILIGFLYSFLDLRYSDKNMVKKTAKNAWNYVAEVSHYDTLDRHIRYVEIGNEEKPLLMFLHGAPSSSSFWVNFLKDSFLLSKVKMLAPDRPGYGYSDYGNPETSIEKQAVLISYILKKKRKLHRQIILHGSSYGGTLVARIAMDYPALVDGIIFQSASTAPGEEKTYDITYPTSKPPLSWLVPSSIQMANYEKLSHRKELEAMLPHWKNIVAPAIILHGTDDGLIYPSNATFTKEHLINSPFVELIMAEGKGHNLTWTRRDLLLSSIAKMLDITKKMKEGNNPL